MHLGFGGLCLLVSLFHFKQVTFGVLVEGKSLRDCNTNSCLTNSDSKCCRGIQAVGAMICWAASTAGFLRVQDLLGLYFWWINLCVGAGKFFPPLTWKGLADNRFGIWKTTQNLNLQQISRKIRNSGRQPLFFSPVPLRVVKCRQHLQLNRSLRCLHSVAFYLVVNKQFCNLIFLQRNYGGGRRGCNDLEKNPHENKERKTQTSKLPVNPSVWLGWPFW